MKNIKKTLKIAGLICLVASLLSIGSLLASIYLFEYNLFYIISYGVEIVLSIVTGCIYLSLTKKPIDTILHHSGLFLTLSIINIFNNLIVWAMSFWVEIAVSNHIRRKQSNAYYEKSNNGDNPIVLDESEYEVTESTQILTQRLTELKGLRQNDMITEEEYQNLRAEAINKFIK